MPKPSLMVHDPDMKPFKLAGAWVALLILLMACQNKGGLSADAQYFKGLPRSVVAEALDNPTLKQNLEGESPAGQQSLAQAAVRNIIFCREELRIYQGWITEGQPPAVSPGPIPAQPLEPGNAAIVQDYASLRTAISSGELSELKLRLTAEGSCGQWIPAAPRDITGPTIAQVVQGQPS